MLRITINSANTFEAVQITKQLHEQSFREVAYNPSVTNIGTEQYQLSPATPQHLLTELYS